MKIEDIKINRFKSLLNISMKDIGNLTILVGKNGSGKTNILETLHHFLTISIIQEEHLLQFLILIMFGIKRDQMIHQVVEQ